MIIFAMETGTAAKFLQNLHSLISLSIVQGTIVRRNRTEEGLESNNTLLIQSLQLIKIGRNQTSPETVMLVPFA